MTDDEVLKPLTLGEGDAELLAWLREDRESHRSVRKLALSDTAVTDAGVAAVAESCPQLRYLNLWACKEVTDVGVAAVTEGCPQLQFLDLSGTKVTDAGARAMAEGCPRLQCLVLSYTRVTDAGVATVVEGCSQLDSLDLTGTAVTDTGVWAIAEHCSQLQFLDLTGTKVTDAGMAAVAEGCRQLRHLNLCWCKLVTDTGVVAAAVHFHRLQSLYLTDTAVRSVDNATLQSGDAQQIFAAILRGVALPVVRVVFVGTGNIGKSFLFERSFLDRVMDPTFREPTADIELIRPERCLWVPTLGAQKLEPRVWDFGGQLVKHGVHETFLGDDGRTVYILVVSANALPASNIDDTDEETGNAVAYWLRTIHHFGGSTAPVVVAVTQCDARAKGKRSIDTPFPPFAKPLVHLTPEELGKPFGVTVTQVLNHLSACQSDEGSIQPLRDAIDAAVALRPGITKQKVSPELLRLRKHVEAELPGFALVSVNTFRKWCDECDVTDTGQQDVLRGILHHMGSLFYFGADREPDFRDRDDLAPGRRRLLRRRPDALLGKYVINPVWLKLAVYQVFEESKGRGWLSPGVVQEKVAAADAAVKQANLDFVPHSDGGLVVEAFLELVELSYFDDEKQMYLFPRGLPRGFAGYDGWPVAWLGWEFVPESAFHRFMVQMHHKQEVPKVTNGGKYAHGRDWVACKLFACPLVVSVDPNAGRIELRFDPTSAQAQREEAYTDVRKMFTRDLIGKPPKEECGVATDSPNQSMDRKPRSITKDDMRVKVIATLMAHHFPNGSDFVGEPIVLSALARSVDTNPGRVSEFFSAEFRGHASYVRMCTRQPDTLRAKLKALNDECSS